MIDLIEGTMLGAYGTNAESLFNNSKEVVKRAKIIAMLTKTPSKARWALNMGFIAPAKLSNTYSLTEYGIKYWNKVEVV